MRKRTMLRLEVERMQKGMTQKALAKAAALSQPTISTIESQRFRPWPRQLSRIATALDWPADRAECLLDLVNIEIRATEVAD